MVMNLMFQLFWAEMWVRGHDFMIFYQIGLELARNSLFGLKIRSKWLISFQFHLSLVKGYTHDFSQFHQRLNDLALICRKIGLIKGWIDFKLVELFKQDLMENYAHFFHA